MRTRWFAIFLAAFLIMSSHQTIQATSNSYDYTETGPYIDRLVYIIIPDPDMRILALQSDYTDIDASFSNSITYKLVLEAHPDISVHQFLRNGYGSITFNCRVYPLNITGFRRAFSYAFSKTQVVTELYGYSKVHDSMIPYINPFCIEDVFDSHWYESEVDIGNAILDELNFTINPATGFRDAPNGESFTIKLGYSETNDNQKVASIAKQALQMLHIDVMITGYQSWLKSFNPFSQFNMVLQERDFSDYGICWLVSEFGSEYANDISINPSGFSNSTFDMRGEQLLNSSSYEGVFQAVAEMQKILHYEVPSVVAYQNYYFQAYREDFFKGHVEDLGRHIDGYWTMLNIKQIDETLGGTVLVSTDGPPDSFNIFVAESNSSKKIFDKIHLGLYTRTPDLEPIPQLVEQMLIETSEENPNVPKGHSRYTIDLRKNATWSDGVNVTAEDVSFTFNYILDSGLCGNPMADDLTELTSVYSPSTQRVVFEFYSESYWNFEKFAYQYILPKHVFDDFSIEEWDSLNISILEDYPVDNVNCGPFVLSDFEEGEFYELSVHPNLRRDYQWWPSGSYVPKLSHSPDFWNLFQFFIIRWNFNWEIVWGQGSESGTVAFDGYRAAFTPGFSAYRYTILLDGEYHLSTPWKFHDWISNQIVIYVNDNSLSLGQHNFTIIVENSYNSEVQIDTVLVTIMLPTFVGTFSVGLTLPFIIFVCFRRIRISHLRGHRKAALV
ncbi:MAG: ABC transporter substrate-binding protein [Candidatus Sifarchaeia archaeon]